MYENVSPPVLPEEFSNPYIYNGAVLPALPDGLEANYPYIVIAAIAGKTILLAAKTQWRRTYYSYTNGYLISAGKGNFREQYDLSDDGQRWEYYGTIEYSITVSQFVWSNHDIYNGTETNIGTALWMGTSEPVPLPKCPFILVFMYKKGAKDWYGVRLVYSEAAFTWNGSAVTNAGTAGNMVYSPEFKAWAEDTFAVDTPEIKPGLDAGVYQRIYTSHDIPDSSGNIWLAAGSVTEAVETVTEKWLRSFRVGLALGLTGKLLPVQEETVIAVQLQNVLYIKKAPAEVSGSILILWGGKGA